MIIVANIKVKEEFTQEIYKELLKIHQATHANDKGCIQYDLHRSIDDKNSFTFIETWETGLDLDEHMKQEHFLSFVKNAEGKLESLEINKLIKEDI
jgi:quinol monooxygenase YgiN